MSAYDHYEDITPLKFLETFSEILNTGNVTPYKKIEARTWKDYFDKPAVKHDKREISIETELNGKKYKMYAKQDNSYGLDIYEIGTNDTSMDLTLMEDREEFIEFMDRYCRAGYDFENSGRSPGDRFRRI